MLSQTLKKKWKRFNGNTIRSPSRTEISKEKETRSTEKTARKAAKIIPTISRSKRKKKKTNKSFDRLFLSSDEKAHYEAHYLSS